MSLSRFILRSLLHYWRTNLAVMAGIGTAAAVLSGALMVGGSVRDSLRGLLYQRLGAAEYLVSADRFFREDLAARLGDAGEAAGPVRACPIIYLQGVVAHEATGLRALDVQVYGVDGRFWKFHDMTMPEAAGERTAAIGAALAEKLGARPGDALLLRIETPQGIPRESLYGRRENIGRTVRLTCGAILPPERLGEFALRPGQGNVYSIFVPLPRLQRDLAQQARANAILLASGPRGGGLESIRKSLEKVVDLQDLGVLLRAHPSRRSVSVESARMILDESVAQAAFDAAAEEGMRASGIFSYLANSIRAGKREIPYSVITAAGIGQAALASIEPARGFPRPSAAVTSNDAIWLNEWARRDLGLSPGDVGRALEVDYYLWRDEGRLETRTAGFRFAGSIAMGGDADAALAPDFPGITDARNMGAWDPPFPLDLRRVRPKDEEYWESHRAAPKAFVTLSRGQELWQSRFGKLTAVRIALPEGADQEAVRRRLQDSLRRRLNPEQAGFSTVAVRQRGLEASEGSTDFGEYFTYFSFFLIAAAVLLSALFFRLGIEQRAREIGTLAAAGFPAGLLRRVFLLEGALLALGGSLLGLIGSLAYGWLMVLGLRTWWIEAVGTRRLYLHVSWTDLGTGAATAMLAAFLTIVWTLRGLLRIPPRALLAGVLEPAGPGRRRARGLRAVSGFSLLSAGAMLLGSFTGRIPDVAGYFGAGVLLLVSILCLIALYLRRADPVTIAGRGWGAFFRLGARNAMHRPGRSLLCVALIASASFIIVSVEAFRQDAAGISLEPASGTGGYPLLARSVLPIVFDMNSAAGREELGIADPEIPALAQARFVPFRVRPGDDASCLNLYAPREPKILGAPRSFLASGRFSFQDSLAATPEQRRNPWLLLEPGPQDGAIPAIGDANTIHYILRLSLGSEIVLRGGDGTPVRLRLVASLRHSIFQGELLISEANFLRAFPGQEGCRFFLLDLPATGSASLVRPLEERLADWGLSVESTRERLAAYYRVENTYLSTFQSLGALGLMLGTAGLAAVLLRNVLERRKELALLRAVGFRKGDLALIVVAENLALLAWGLASGTICALLAILPALLSRGAAFPAATVGLVLAGVLAAGLSSSVLAALAAFRSPLLEALRSE